MNSVRKIIFFFLAITIAAFAGPSIGGPPPNKLYSVTMVVGQLNTVPGDPLQGTTPVTAYVTNESPTGSNASFSSFALSLSSVSGLIIQSVDQPSGGGFAQLDPSGTFITVTNIPGVKPQAPPFVVTMHVRGCGDGNGWTPTIWTGSNLSGFTFDQDPSNPSLLTTDVACGSVSCAGALATVIQPDGTISGVRGKYNQDGTTCTVDSVNYFVTNTISVNDVLKFRWDVAAAPAAAFRYSILDGQGHPISWTQGTSKVAWLCDPAGDPSCWVLAQPCERGNPNLAEPYLPWPYATLIADNGKTIKVDTSAFSSVNPLPPLPFPIFVETERMLVTKINLNTSTWTVQRCQGGTCTSATTHQPNLNVMSTPLGILPTGTKAPYKAGDQAKACYVPGTNNLVDIGDAWSEP